MSPADLAACGLRPAPRRKLEEKELPEPLPGHVGLWLDRMLDGPFDPQVSGWPGRRRLYEVAEAALRAEPPAVSTYRQIFRRWESALAAPHPGVHRRTIPLEATSRLLLHPASGESVTEGAVLLHHTYSVPYLPGSALKGLARARIERAPSAAGATPPAKLAEALFGPMRVGEQDREDERASYLEFLDALWIPEKPVGRASWRGPLALDVVTPHHSAYYSQGNGARPLPTDGDNPIPVHRLTVAPGTLFLLVVESDENVSRWTDFVVDRVLLPALAEDGIGAATVAGYGRAKPQSSPGQAPSRGAPPRASTTSWSSHRVAWDRSTRTLRANVEGAASAIADEPTAKALLEALGEATRSRLVDKGREILLEVQITREGSWSRIVGLREPAPR